MNAKVISVIDALVSNGSKWKSSRQAIRTGFLEAILITSFLIATLLIIIPYQYKNGNPVPTVIFNGIPSTAFHGFVVLLLYAFTGSLIALLIHDNTSCSFLPKFCERLAMCKIVVGNGCRIQFWHDRWFRDLQLKVEFPRLFRLSMDKNGLLSSFTQRRAREGDWRLQFRRSLFVWEEEEVKKMQLLLRDVPRLNVDLQDVVRWAASPSGEFTVLSVRNWLMLRSGSRLLVPRMIWINEAPPKAQFISWMAWRGRIKTAVVLQRLGVLGYTAATDCPFCSAVVESVDHLFVQCFQIWKVWRYLLHWWNLCWVSPATVNDVLSWWLGTKHKKTMKKIWMLVPVAMLWSTWKLRNEVVFNGKQPDMNELGEVVKVRVGLWVKSSMPSVQYSVHQIVENLSQVKLCI